MECDDAKPKWAVDHGLKLCGQYFQGFVDDYEAALSHHTMETRPELIIHFKLPIIQLFYSQKLALLFKIYLPIIQTISPIIQVIYT